MPSKAGNSHQAYRILSTTGRRVAANEPGTLRQQVLVISLYLDSQADERLTGTQAKRLRTVCHALATDRPIHWDVQS